jgi:uncharacterized RDD family membrane protein YckC
MTAREDPHPASDDVPSVVPREARAHQGRPAGLVSRSVAATIDAVVVVVALAVGYVGLAGLVFMIDPRGFSFPDVGLVLSLTVGLGTLVAYLTLAWWLAGRTYGDLVMGLRVVSRGGDRIGVVVSWARAVGCALFPWGLFWVAASRDRSSLHDLVLRTRVIYDWQPRPHTPPGDAGSAKSPR